MLGASCVLGALLTAACGPAGTAAAPTKTVTVTVTPSAPATSPPASSSGPLPCLTSDLRLTAGQANGAAGTIYYPLDFTNASGSACTMYGYPGAAFASSPRGGQFGAPAGRRSAAAATLVTVPPGVSVHATLAVSDVLIGNNCRHQVQVHWVQAYPPGQYVALYAPLSRVACADPALVTMTVTVISSGP